MSELVVSVPDIPKSPNRVHGLFLQDRFSKLTLHPELLKGCSGDYLHLLSLGRLFKMQTSELRAQFSRMASLERWNLGL